MHIAITSDITGQILKPESESRVYQIGELSRAINNNELCLQYQPRYNSNTGRLITVEALVRWQHPEHGLLYPDSFIPLAEEVDLINPLGLWVFERSCRDLYYLQNLLEDDIKISINLSILQCEHAEFAQNILHICHTYCLSLSCFEFEINGCSGDYDKDKVLEFCNILAAIGAHFSLEDFGTSLSPLRGLCELPVNLIKIQTDSAKKTGYRERNKILLKNMINLGHEMQAVVVAKDIEYDYQRDLLVSLGCDQLQGFLMCKPIKLENMTDNIFYM